MRPPGVISKGAARRARGLRVERLEVRPAPEGDEEPADRPGPADTTERRPGTQPRPPVPLAADPDGSGRPVWIGGRALRGLLRQGTAGQLMFGLESLVALGFLVTGGPVWRALMLHWLICVTGFSAQRLYSPRLQISFLDDLPALLKSCVLSLSLVAVCVAVLDARHELLRFLGLAVAGTVALLGARCVAYSVVCWARRSGRTTYTTVVLGGGEVARKLVAMLDRQPSYGLRVLGYLDDAPEQASGSANWRRLGAFAELPELLRDRRVQTLIVGFGCTPDAELVRTLRRARFAALPVFVVPRLFEIGHRPGGGDHIGAIPVVRIRPASTRLAAQRAKRALDVSLSAAALVLLSPLLALVALLVRLETGPGVIFRQVRIGRDGEPFEMLKFRSLRPARPGEGDLTWSIAGDARVGRIGRFIRATSLDELPQLVNVLRGEMTLVGPRPERPYFVDRFSVEIPEYAHRHRVIGGLTGFAQVSGLRGDTSIEDRARFDNYYIDNWSVWMDVKLLLRTLSHLIGGRGA